jgi:hypothetical protein
LAHVAILTRKPVDVEGVLMKLMRFAFVPLVVCLIAVFCLSYLTRNCSAEEPTRDQKTDQLIAQLGSESFQVREAATRQLMEREEAIPALRQASKSSDAEVASRAGRILDAFVRKEKERIFAKFADLAKQGAVDQAIERFVRREKWDDEPACWQVVADLATRLTDLERKTYGKASLPDSVRDPGQEFRRLVKSLQLKVVSTRGAAPEQWKNWIVLRAEEIATGYHLDYGLFAFSGSVKILGSATKSAVFAGGSVEIDNTNQALIVCDGDFKAKSDIHTSLIIARGTIRCEGDVINSQLICCGDIQLKRPKRVFDSEVVEKESKPLGFVTFFDPANVGIKVETADGGVRVKEAVKGKQFAAAGLRGDDLITALDGEAVKDAESFRRLLRAKLAVDGEMVFKVRRGDNVSEITVKHKD